MVSQENPPETTYQDYFNFVILGNEGVGKSSICDRFCNEKFATEKRKKKPIELFKKSLVQNDTEYSLKFWDTQYDENSFKLNKTIYDRADCLVIVCAINDKKSFDSIDTWIQALSENINITGKQMLLLANKVDLEDERQIGVDELIQKAEELDINFYETSAKEDTCITEAFQTIIKKVVNNVYKEGKTELKADERNNSSGSTCAG